jgi:hypothetical protein
LDENEPQNELEKAFVKELHQHIIAAEVFAGVTIQDRAGKDVTKPIENIALVTMRDTLKKFQCLENKETKTEGQ